jgi:hypothetical protein
LKEIFSKKILGLTIYIRTSLTYITKNEKIYPFSTEHLNFLAAKC